MQKQPVRLGVDIGGTFTDVVLERGDDLFSTKVLTTYSAPEEAIVEGMARVCAQAQIDPTQITQIIHRHHSGHKCFDRAPRCQNRFNHHRRVPRCD